MGLSWAPERQETPGQRHVLWLHALLLRGCLSSLEYLSHPGVVRVGSVPSGCGPSSGTWSSVPSARACSGQWSQIPVSSSPVGSPTFSDIRAHRRPRWSLSTISFLFFLINVMWRRGQRSSVPDLPGKAALHYGGSKETVGSPPSAEDSGPWTPNADKDEGREEEPRRICPMDGDTALSVTQQVKPPEGSLPHPPQRAHRGSCSPSSSPP